MPKAGVHPRKPTDGRGGGDGSLGDGGGIGDQSHYTFDQVEQLWIQYGGSREWAATMAGIAMAESAGQTGVLNNNEHTHDYSVGLFQINYFGDMLQGRTQEFGSPAALARSPRLQVRAAMALLGDGSGLSNWEGDTVGQVALDRGGRPLSSGEVQQIMQQNDVSEGGGSGGYTTPGGGYSGPTGGGGGGGGFQPGDTGGNFDPNQAEERALGNQEYSGPGAYRGFDLGALPAFDQASAKNAINKYLDTPGEAQKVTNETQSLYGFVSWMFDIPAVKTILVVGTMAGWNSNQIFGAVQATNWWQTHDANQRYWAQITGSDPATAQEALNEARAAILRTAATIGLPVGYFKGNELTAMAEVIASNSMGSTGSVPDTGFTQDQIVQLVASAYKYKAGQKVGGDIATLTDSYSKLAGEYLVPQSQQAIGQAVQGAVQGDYNQAGFTTGATSAYENLLRSQAIAEYPYMKEAILSGITPTQFADSYRQTAASILQINPEQVSMGPTGPNNMNFALNQVTKTGKQPMSLADFSNVLRSDPKYGYQYTTGANNAAWQGASQILDALGAVPAPVAGV